MCKLYALQTTMTKRYARNIIADRVKTILRTESNGLGMALNVDGATRVWQCGESFTDAIGGDIVDGLDDTLKMATLIIHGRTSTSDDRTVNHSHPRPTKYGPMIHNGVVVPRVDTLWEMDYALDSDYLAELVSRDELHLAAQYLHGYAGVMLIKDDGTLIVQNQGANLYATFDNNKVEFGTTTSLCAGGNKFELMKAESNSCFVAIEPIEPMTGRIIKYDRVTNIGVGEKKAQLTFPRGTQTSGETDGTRSKGSGSSGRTREEMGKNPKKKGKKNIAVDRDFFGFDDFPLDLQDVPEYRRNRLKNATEDEVEAFLDYYKDAYGA